MPRTQTVTPDLALDAYSFSRFGKSEWKKCTAYLLKRYTCEQTEVILYSKLMRWASNDEASYKAFVTYMENTSHDEMANLFLEARLP